MHTHYTHTLTLRSNNLRVSLLNKDLKLFLKIREKIIKIHSKVYNKAISI